MSVAEAVQLTREHRLPREAVPTPFLTAPEVWAALLETDMPMTALIRNLATLTRVGLLVPGSDALVQVLSQLGDTQRLRAARIHPIPVLAARPHSAALPSCRSMVPPITKARTSRP